MSSGSIYETLTIVNPTAEDGNLGKVNSFFKNIFPSFVFVSVEVPSLNIIDVELGTLRLNAGNNRT